MPFDSNGNFSRIHNWEDDRRNGIEIVTDHHDEEDNNFADGLSQCLLKDGRTPMQNDFDAGNFQIKNVRTATLDKDAVNFAQLKSQIEELQDKLLSSFNAALKLGDIKASVLSENHGNWLLCNGQAVCRSEYADLFALIGTQFGTGDGTKTFNVPDYRGKFLRGLGGDSAEDIYTTQAESLPKIEGNLSLGIGSYHGTGILDKSGAFSSSQTDVSTSSYRGYDDEVLSTSKKDVATFKASDSSEIYNGSHVTPINQAVNYFIKAKEED